MADLNRSVLSIRGLRVAFVKDGDRTEVLNGVDLDLDSSGSLALLGESGSGKSVLAFAILRLLEGVAEVTGKVLYQGEDVYAMKKEKLLDFRGSCICLVPQSSATAFDPMRKVGLQISDFIRKVGREPHDIAKRRTLEEMRRLGLEPAERLYDDYPHRYSGGMLERALVACATATSPPIIIADEPTKGLDGVTKGIVLDALMSKVKGGSVLMITHDADAAALCDRSAILYRGEIVEVGKSKDVLDAPFHPYTKGLLDSMPAKGLRPIPRNVRPSTGVECCYYDRCPEASGICVTHPGMKRIGCRDIRCWYVEAR